MGRLNEPRKIMAKKKILKLKIKKQTMRRWRRDPWVRAGAILLVLIIGIGLGMLGMVIRPTNQHPQNLVWASDSRTKIPPDLISYLQDRKDCQASSNKASAGVGLWGVYQVSKGRFAKVAYGCSTNMTLYIMAVKTAKQWQLLQPSTYFSVTGFLPKCAQIDQYQIDKSIEPYCIKDDGSARANEVN